jgi:hypothetical protein
MEFCCISLAKKTEPQIAHRHAFIDADIPPRITIRRVIFIESDSERIPRSLLRGSSFTITLLKIILLSV